jgi:segregation and condensation protein B
MNNKIINSIEALLFGAGRPLRLSEIKGLLEIDLGELELSSIKIALNSLEERYQNSSIELKEVASGYRLQVKQEFSNCLSSLWNDKSKKISIIAYKQPVTRGDIEEIRGVNVSTQTVRNLLERDWVKVSGYRDVPGRPALYSTTPNFLNDFNLKKINELPDLPETEEIDEEFKLQAI